jgi:hypothetical protein
MALALLHHLVGSQGITFDAFARVLDMFSKRFAIVEFIPREDAYVSTWPGLRAEWYDEGSFVAAMSPYFRLRETKPSTPEPRRILLFERTEGTV